MGAATEMDYCEVETRNRSMTLNNVSTVQKFLADVFDDDSSIVSPRDGAGGPPTRDARAYSQPPLESASIMSPTSRIAGGRPIISRHRSATIKRFTDAVFDDDSVGITPSGSESNATAASGETRRRGTSCITMTDEGVAEMNRWAGDLFGPAVEVRDTTGDNRVDSLAIDTNGDGELDTLLSASGMDTTGDGRVDTMVVGGTVVRSPQSAGAAPEKKRRQGSGSPPCDPEMKKQIADTLALVKAQRAEKKRQQELLVSSMTSKA